MEPLAITTRSGQCRGGVVCSWPMKMLSLALPEMDQLLTFTLRHALMSMPSRSFEEVIFVAVICSHGMECAVYSESNQLVSKQASWLFWQDRPSTRRSW